MSNSVFHFILGLTLGILIALALINRYHIGDTNFTRHNNGITSDSSSPEAKQSLDDKGAAVVKIKIASSKSPSIDDYYPIGEVIKSSSDSATSDGEASSKSPTSPSASYWIPGTKGAYLNFKNAGVASSSEAEPADTEASDSNAALSKPLGVAEMVSNFFSGGGEDLRGGRKRNPKSRRSNGAGNSLTGSIMDRGRGGASEAFLPMDQLEDTQNEHAAPESELNMGPFGAVQRGNGKRKRGPKGARGGKKVPRDSAPDNAAPASELASAHDVSPAYSPSSGVSAGDDINIQSRFFTAAGDRVDPQTVTPVAGGKSLIVFDHPPLLPYHSHAHLQAPLSPPYVPSLASVLAQRAIKIHREDELSGAATVPKISYDSNVNGHPKPLPNMAQQKGPSEVDHLKLHICNAVFEAYSGAWLTTKQHMLNVASESYNLTWVNCEMASFIHMRDSKKISTDPFFEGMVIQSLDVLDFSVIHLSAFERSSRKYRKNIWTTKEDQNSQWSKIEPVKEAARILEAKNNPKSPGAEKIIWSDEAKRTVAIMPFLGGAMGAGHSELGNRFDYLKACFWSLYEFVPNIVAGVSRQEDVDWCKNESGLPFYDVLLLEIPKGAGLPVATTQRTKELLKSGKWPFDYIFFTESDQILIARTMPMMYDHLKKYPGRMILPHRLMPYSNQVVTTVHKKNTSEIVLNSWMNQSCCMARTNCQNRKGWKDLKDPEVKVINYYGLYVPLGNVNFLDESYRTCTMSPHIGDYCP